MASGKTDGQKYWFLGSLYMGQCLRIPRSPFDCIVLMGAKIGTAGAG